MFLLGGLKGFESCNSYEVGETAICTPALSFKESGKYPHQPRNCEVGVRYRLMGSENLNGLPSTSMRMSVSELNRRSPAKTTAVITSGNTTEACAYTHSDYDVALVGGSPDSAQTVS